MARRCWWVGSGSRGSRTRGSRGRKVAGGGKPGEAGRGQDQAGAWGSATVPPSSIWDSQWELRLSSPLAIQGCSPPAALARCAACTMRPSRTWPILFVSPIPLHSARCTHARAVPLQVRQRARYAPHAPHPPQHVGQHDPVCLRQAHRHRGEVQSPLLLPAQGAGVCACACACACVCSCVLRKVCE